MTEALEAMDTMNNAIILQNEVHNVYVFHLLLHQPLEIEHTTLNNMALK